MSFNEAIENIVNQIATNFGAEDEAQNKSFKDGIRQACVTHLNALQMKLTQLEAQIPTPGLAAASPTKRGGNGYNLFASEQRHNLIKEMGGEEKAKEEFKKRGGVTGVWIREAWHKLSDEEKGQYNAEAKAGRDAAALPQVQQMLMTPQGVVPIQVAAPKRAQTTWQRFQKAWSAELKAQKDAGQAVPSFGSIGERTKACSAAYKEFKVKTPQEQETYFHMHA